MGQSSHIPERLESDFDRAGPDRIGSDRLSVVLYIHSVTLSLTVEEQKNVACHFFLPFFSLLHFSMASTIIIKFEYNVLNYVSYVELLGVMN